MQPKQLGVRIAAVASSLLLVGGFIYARAGGHLPNLWKSPEPLGEETSPDKAALIYGSKSAPAFPEAMPEGTVILDSSSEATSLLPGSKSFILAEPSSQPTTPTNAQSPSTYGNDPPSNLPTDVLLPGSKSDAILLPPRNIPPPPPKATNIGNGPPPGKYPGTK
jgi:hypothetical protein